MFDRNEPRQQVSARDLDLSSKVYKNNRLVKSIPAPVDIHSDGIFVKDEDSEKG